MSRPQTTESEAYAHAAQVLDSVVASVLEGEVTVENIDTITRNERNFERIIMCYYGQPNAKTGVDCEDILQKTKELACEVREFKRTRRNLQFLCERCALVLPARGKGRG